MSKESYNNLISASLYDKGMELMNLGYDKEAAMSFQQSVEVNPKNFDAQFNLGLSLFNQEKYYESILPFNEAMTLHLQNKLPRYYLGKALDRIARIDRTKHNLFHSRAIKYFNEAIGINPCFIPAHEGKISSLESLGRIDEAIKAAEYAIKLNPNSASSHFKVGKLYMSITNYKKAISCFEDAISLDKKFILAYINKAESLYALDQNQESLACINQVIAIITAETQSNNPSKDELQMLGNVLVTKDKILKKIEINFPEHVPSKGVEHKSITKEFEEAITSKEKVKIFIANYRDGIFHNTDHIDLLEQILLKLNNTDSTIDLIVSVLVTLSSDFGAQINPIREKISQLESKLHGVNSLDEGKIEEIQLGIKEHNIRISLLEEQHKVYDLIIKKLLPLAHEIEANHAAQEAINDSPYKTGFYQELQKKLNAGYLAASVVQTDIVPNQKKGILGSVAEVMTFVSKYVPLVGFTVAICGTILASVDENIQKRMVKKYADFSVSISELDIIAKKVAHNLIQSVLDPKKIVDKDWLKNIFTNIFEGIVTSEEKIASIIDTIDTLTIVGSTLELATELAKDKISETALDTIQRKKDDNKEFVIGKHHGEVVATGLIAKMYKGELEHLNHTNDNEQKATSLTELALDDYKKS